MARGFAPSVALDILRRDGYTCIYCDGFANLVDHVIPYSKGGITSKGNGVACCQSCNARKRGRLLEEYLIKGLVHLTKNGEDIGWIDNLLRDKLQLSYAQDYALRLLLQSKLELSEISFLLMIDEDMLKQYVGTMES